MVEGGEQVELALRTGVAARMSVKDAEFEAYLVARQASLLRTAYLLTGNRQEAEDLVQTTFAKLYLAWDKVQRRELIDGYVRRILVNEHHSLWRRAWKRREYATDRLPEVAGRDVVDDGEAAAVWKLVQGLPPKQRAVIVLRYYEDLSEAEIASTLGISPGTVKSQASRALAHMRARMSTDALGAFSEEDR